MGRWKIDITGHGIHNNGRDDDAEAMAQKFVADLQSKGHDVEAAGFELLGGGPLNLLPTDPAHPVDGDPPPSDPIPTVVK